MTTNSLQFIYALGSSTSYQIADGGHFESRLLFTKSHKKHGEKAAKNT